MTLWKKMMAPPAVATPSSTAEMRLWPARAVREVTAPPHSTPSSRINVVRTLSKGGGLGLDNRCSRRLATRPSAGLTPTSYVRTGRCIPD